MKAVQLLVESSLPEDLRDPNRTYDSKGLGALMAEVARKHPDQYEAIAQKLSSLGLKASYRQGESLRLKDLRPVIDRKAYFDQMEAEILQARKEAIDDKDFQRRRLQIWQDYSKRLQDASMKASLQQGNNLGYSIVSGARGKAPQLKMMVTTPGLYEDSQGNPIPIFVRNSFAEGLRPSEFLAGTYGARSSVISTKRATAKGGYLAKLMVQAATPLMVTEQDCGTDNGVDLEPDDGSLPRRILARPAGGYPAGTVLDRDAIAALKRQKVNHVVTRSALTCKAPYGVCSKCLGVDQQWKPYPVGYAAGITSAQAISEPITQSALNSKHTGGVSEGKREYSGFQWINQFVQAPEEFPEEATLSTLDGKVKGITDAPQGGKFILVEDQQHYVPDGFQINVKVGDQVEPGDPLADGLINPSKIVQLRGLGSGRRFYADRLKKILDDSGLDADRRDTEVLARAAINHLNIDELDDPSGALPDDVVNYNTYASQYEPREGAEEIDTDKAVGRYLEQPALHYSIGTRLTPKMAKRLAASGFNKVQTHRDAPGITPVMIRLQSASHNNPDWLASQHTSYLKRQLTDAAYRGDDTNVKENVHFVPRLAIGEGFGKNTDKTGKF